MKPIEEFLTPYRKLGVRFWMKEDRLCYRAPKGALSPSMLADLAANADVAGLRQKCRARN